MEEVKTIKLEDGIEYIVVDEINYKDNTYFYLGDERKLNTFKIRKMKTNDPKQMLNGLDSDEEFDKAMLLFSEKHKNDNK